MKGEYDTKIESCPLPAELVAYLYDEMPTRERTAFETHLTDCRACTDELADLSFARLDVYEWHRDEFAEMPTPRIVIPYGEPVKVTLVEAVRAFFGSPARWATVGGAFAVAALVFGIWMTLSRDTEIVKTLPSPTPSGAEKMAPVGGPKVPPALVQKDEDPSEPEIERSTVKTGEARAVKTAATRDTRPRRAVRTQSDETRPARAKRTSPPRLNDFEDEDDNTLRLGDLLAEVDTRE